MTIEDEILTTTQSKTLATTKTYYKKGTSTNPIMVLEKPPALKSFKDIVSGNIMVKIQEKEEVGVQLRPPNIPHVEGGNLIVELDMEAYNRDVEELRYSVVGQNFIQKGNSTPTTMDLKAKLASKWGFEEVRIIPMEGGFFTCF